MMNIRSEKFSWINNKKKNIDPNKKWEKDMGR